VKDHHLFLPYLPFPSLFLSFSPPTFVRTMGFATIGRVVPCLVGSVKVFDIIRLLSIY
jgi:hypothetical protein